MKNSLNQRGTSLASWKKSASQMCFGLAVMSALLVVSAPSQANPNGGSVVSGSVTIAGEGTSAVTVTQTTQKGLINWANFDIANGEVTTFDQQFGNNSITVNRVQSGSMSTINGAIKANGNVVVINPNGLMIGATGTIDTAGFVATTADVNDGNVSGTNGKLNFKNASPDTAATITNNGTITVADEGLVALVAPTVRNNGVIQGNYAKIQMAAADTVAIDLYGDGLLSFAASSGPTSRTLTVENNGWISADAGQIIMTAADASSLIDSVINNTGELRAHSLVGHEGEVILVGSGATINVDGDADHNIDVSACATCVISGVPVGTSSNGGTVKIGTAYDFKNKSVTEAQTVTVGTGSVILANGGNGGETPTNNSGGKIIINSTDSTDVAGQLIVNGAGPGAGGTIRVSSDNETTFTGTANANGGSTGDGGLININSGNKTTVSGTLTAKAGSLGGNGGRVVTRSTKVVSVDGATVDASAPAGDIGEWYIAAKDMVVTGTTGLSWGDKSYIDTAALEKANANITLRSRQDIDIQDDISITNPLVNLAFVAGKNGSDISGDANGSTYDLEAGGGDIILNGKYIRTVGGDVTMLSGNSIYLHDAVIYLKGLNGGNGGNYTGISGGITIDGTVIYARGGDVTLRAVEGGGISNYVDGIMSIDNSMINTTTYAMANTGHVGGYDFTGIWPVDLDVFKNYSDNTLLENLDGGKITLAASILNGGNNCFAAGGNACTPTDPLAKTDITVTTSDGTKVYGDLDPTLTYTVSGVLYGDMLTTGGLTRVSGENVGNYLISASGFSVFDGVGNYNIVYSNTGNLAITPATLTVTADSLSKFFGQVDPTLTYAASGFKFSDDAASVLSGLLAREAGEAVGAYAINLGTLASNGNYTISFVPGAFTISNVAVPGSVSTFRLNVLGRPVISYENNVIANNLPFKGYEVLTMDTNVSIKMASNQSAAALNAIAPAGGGEMSPEQLNAMAPAGGGNGNAGDEGVACGNNFLDNKPCGINQ